MHKNVGFTVEGWLGNALAPCSHWADTTGPGLAQLKGLVNFIF